MASNSKRLKLCSHNEDRISGLPDGLLCHILSFFPTREAVRTSVLSHRWKNVWASVPTLDLDEDEYRLEYTFRTLPLPIRYDPDSFVQFVNRVLMYRFPGDIHRFRLVTRGVVDVSLIYAWISAAIIRNVVELDLTVGTPHFEIPRKLFMCSTLVRLKLWLRRDISAIIPSAKCFRCLKFLQVTTLYPDSDTMEKIFSRCFPVLEELILDGDLEDASAFKLDISAPRLKRLQIRLFVHKFAMISAAGDSVNYVCQIFISADAPYLEELDICSDVLLSFSLKNAKCLNKAKIDFFSVKELEYHDCFLGLADRICQLFAGICDAKYLTVEAPILAALDIRYQRLLPAFNNLSHLELELQSCRCLQTLATLLKTSPNLEHLKISVNRKSLLANDSKYCEDENEEVLMHEWDAPEFANIYLISNLKTVCLADFKGCPNDMEVAKYLVKHGKSLNKVIVHTRFSENKEMESLSPIVLSSQFAKFPRGSKNCEIEVRTIV